MAHRKRLSPHKAIMRALIFAAVFGSTTRAVAAGNAIAPLPPAPPRGNSKAGPPALPSNVKSKGWFGGSWRRTAALGEKAANEAANTAFHTLEQVGKGARAGVSTGASLAAAAAAGAGALEDKAGEGVSSLAQAIIELAKALAIIAKYGAPLLLLTIFVTVAADDVIRIVENTTFLGKLTVAGRERALRSYARAQAWEIMVDHMKRNGIVPNQVNDFYELANNSLKEFDELRANYYRERNTATDKTIKIIGALSTAASKMVPFAGLFSRRNRSPGSNRIPVRGVPALPARRRRAATRATPSPNRTRAKTPSPNRTRAKTPSPNRTRAKTPSPPKKNQPNSPYGNTGGMFNQH